MIQGGGFDLQMVKKPTRGPIRNESTNGLTNSIGTIAMARTNDPDSATSQFYINLKENYSLNGAYNNPGYTVFGSVIEGMDVVMNIAETPVQSISGVSQNVPINQVVIQSITLLKPPLKKDTSPKPTTTNKIEDNTKTNEEN